MNRDWDLGFWIWDFGRYGRDGMGWVGCFDFGGYDDEEEGYRNEM